MTDAMPGEDPGWGPLGRIVVDAFLPGRAARRAAGERNALVALRSLFLAFALAQVMIGVVVLVLFAGETQGEPSISTGVAVGGTFAIGLALVVMSWSLLRALPCDDLGRLIGAYRSRFFLRIALAEASTLIGFAASLLAESPLPYVAGLVPAAIGFARLAPTAANLRREDDALLARGCPHSLYRTLLQAQLGGPSEGDGT